MRIDKLVTDILGERPDVKDKALRELIMARMKAGGAVMMKRGGKAKGGEVQAAPYGLRETGMPKGRGYFGELPTADGVMTELSASDDAGDFPLIVPTLTRQELEHLQSGGEPTEEIYAKAKAWAESRKGQGRDPFATSEDLRMPVPEYGKGGLIKALRSFVLQDKGQYGARRVDRAADEIPNLEKMYSLEALEEAFRGDNAKALMTLDPKRFEEYAAPLRDRPEVSKKNVKYLSKVGPFSEVPFLMLNKQEYGLPLKPLVTGHEGRHRSRALAKKGESKGLVVLWPRGELREPLPRREQQEYIEALRDELGLTDNLVMPEFYQDLSLPIGEGGIQRPEIQLPDLYAKGGEVKAQDGGVMGSGIARGLAGMNRRSGDRRRERPDVPSQSELQAMFLDVPAGLGVPFAEAGAEALRGNMEDAQTSAAIDAALLAIPGAAAVAKPAYRAVKGAVQKAAPAVREAARGALESGMESGLIQGPSYAVKPSGGQWLGGYRGDTRALQDMPNIPGSVTSSEVRHNYANLLENAKRKAANYKEQTGLEDNSELMNIRDLQNAITQMDRQDAVRNWFNSNLNKYIRKQMGTPDDPVLKLAEQGILHMPQREVTLLSDVADQRELAGFPRLGIATTDLGKMWETLTDTPIKQIEAGKLRDPEYMTDIRLRREAQDRDFGRPGSVTNQPDYLSVEDARNARNFPMGYENRHRSMMENNPWLERVDPSTPIYALSGSSYNVARSLGFDHIVDVLKADLASGRMRPEQLSKMSMEQAVRRTNEYDLERAAAMAKAAEEEMAGLTVAKTFDDGYKIVQLDKPGQFAKESDRMGHSVRGYEPERGSKEWTEASGTEGSLDYGHGGWDAIKSGKAQVFSIRDAKNQPHVTIELGKRDVSPHQWFKSLTDEEKTSAIESGKRVAIERGLMPSGGSSQETMPALNRLQDEYLASHLASYSPQFAEFENNAPLLITQIKGKQNRKPDENYLPYVQKFIREGNYEVAGDLWNSGLIDTADLRFDLASQLGAANRAMADLPDDMPRYITKSELDRYTQTGKFEPEFKRGGAVQKYAKGGEVDVKRLAPFYGAAPVDTEEEDAKRRLRELEGRVLERDYIEPQKDDLESMVRRGLRSGLGKVMSPEGSKRSADILTDVASFVAPPMWGYESGQALGRGYTAARMGDYGEAALEGGLGVLGVLPAVPGAGVAARGAERAANIGSTAIRRPFTPATLTVEATAPDLGQGASYGFRQGLNDVLLQDIAAGRKAREGTGVFKSEITKRLETNPMLAVDIPRAGRIGEMAGSNEALRREIAQAGVDLNQEAMAAHRFIPLLSNNPADASAMLIKTKGGLSGEQIAELASRLGDDMVVTHNPKLGGVVIYPFGRVGKGGAPEFDVAKKVAQDVLGKKGKIQYGVADYDKDRLIMWNSKGDYQKAGANPMSPEQEKLRNKLKGLESFTRSSPRMFSSAVTKTERSSPLESALQSSHRTLPGKVR